MTDGPDETTEDQPTGDEQVFTGVCRGGPLDGMTYRSRFPRGALLIDRPASEAWLYDFTDGVFQVRAEEPMPVRDDEEKSRFRAADEPEFDVWAAPWIGDPGLVDAYADEPDDDELVEV